MEGWGAAWPVQTIKFMQRFCTATPGDDILLLSLSKAAPFTFSPTLR